MTNTQAFDPLLHLPRTDEEAEIALRFPHTSELGDRLVNAFYYLRNNGASLMTAYETILQAALRELLKPAPRRRRRGGDRWLQRIMIDEENLVFDDVMFVVETGSERRIIATVASGTSARDA